MTKIVLRKEIGSAQSPSSTARLTDDRGGRGRVLLLSVISRSFTKFYEQSPLSPFAMPIQA